MFTRRKFLSSSAAATAVLALGACRAGNQFDAATPASGNAVAASSISSNTASAGSGKRRLGRSDIEIRRNRPARPSKF